MPRADQGEVAERLHRLLTQDWCDRKRPVRDPAQCLRNPNDCRTFGFDRWLPEGTPDQPEAVERDDAPGSYGSRPAGKRVTAAVVRDGVASRTACPVRFAAGLPTVKTTRFKGF